MGKPFNVITYLGDIESPEALAVKALLVKKGVSGSEVGRTFFLNACAEEGILDPRTGELIKSEYDKIFKDSAKKPKWEQTKRKNKTSTKKRTSA